MVIVGPQQGWQCPLCKSIYSPATPMCSPCSNPSTKVTSSIGVDFDPSKINYGSVTVTDISIGDPIETTVTDNGIRVLKTTVENKLQASDNLSRSFPDNPTEGHNPNFPYEI